MVKIYTQDEYPSIITTELVHQMQFHKFESSLGTSVLSCLMPCERKASPLILDDHQQLFSMSLILLPPLRSV